MSVLEYEELGMEAVWKIDVEDFPAFIVVDDKGNDFFTDPSGTVTVPVTGIRVRSARSSATAAPRCIEQPLVVGDPGLPRLDHGLPGIFTRMSTCRSDRLHGRLTRQEPLGGEDDLLADRSFTALV